MKEGELPSVRKSYETNLLLVGQGGVGGGGGRALKAGSRRIAKKEKKVSKL